MKKYLLVAMMLVGTVRAQTPQPTVGASLNIFAEGSKDSGPKTIREYSLLQINSLHAYHKSKEKIQSPDMLFMDQNSPAQTVTVEEDGKIDLSNISIEDAFLYVYGMEAEQRLSTYHRWDRQQEALEEERKHNPPSTLKTPHGTYKIHPVKKLPGDILATTQCWANRINVLMDQGAKRVSVLHEMMHVASNCDDSKSLHRAIYELQYPLLKLFQDNPAMMDYLLKKPKPEMPTIASVHLVLDPVQAKRQDHLIPACTPTSTTTCYDPSLPHIEGHLYAVKSNCEAGEGVKCTSLFDGTFERWVPIGKPVFEDKSETQ